jgi:hypothetical protein
MSERYPNALPRELPAEVKALGEPAQTFAPTGGNKINLLNLALAAGAALTALMSLILATVFFAMYHSGFGANPAPPAVALSLALGCGVLGSAFLAVTVWLGERSFGASGWRTYLLFDEVLVELLPDRHRILPWTRIGGLRRSLSILGDYTFPVAGEDPVTFDVRMTGHTALAQAITRSCMVQRVMSTLAPGETLDSLRTGVAAPYVLARQRSANTPVYRVSLVGSCLLFLKIIEGGVRSTANNFGVSPLVAGTVAALEYRYFQNLKGALNKLAHADPSELLRVSGEFPGSCVITNADVRALRVKPTVGLETYGRLELDHAKDGLVCYDLITVPGMHLAAEDPSKFFSNVASV